MRDFIRKVGFYTAHLHIVDARGDHDEGLQIDEGEIDFEALGEDLDRWILTYHLFLKYGKDIKIHTI
jgi:sugar phosphate isomerase/epimerase